MSALPIARRVPRPARPPRRRPLGRREAILSIVQQPATGRSRAALAELAASDPHDEVRRRAAWALRIQRGEGHSHGVRADRRA
jgi:hypothetical protein